MPSEVLSKRWDGQVGRYGLSALVAAYDTVPFGFGTGGWSIMLTPMIQLANCQGQISFSIDWLGMNVTLGIKGSER